MSQHINLKILTPEKILIDKKIEGMILPGSNGAFGVYVDHAPIVSKLKVGDIKINESPKNGNLRNVISIQGGFLLLEKNQAIVLANT